MAILLPTPHREERAPGRAEDKGNQKQRQMGGGGEAPLCSVLWGSQRAKSSFLLEKVNGTQKKWEGSKRLGGL